MAYCVEESLLDGCVLDVCGESLFRRCNVCFI